MNIQSFYSFKKNNGIIGKCNKKGSVNSVSCVLNNFGYKNVLEKTDLTDYKVLPFVRDFAYSGNHNDIIYTVSRNVYKNEIVLKIYSKCKKQQEN